MKNRVIILAAVSGLLSLVATYGQFGPRGAGGMGGPRTPELGGSMAKLFGNNSAYSATLEWQIANPSGGPATTMQGKMAFDNGRTRMEMDMAAMKGLPPEHAAQMKSMGMDKMVTISLPEKKVHYLIYPGMQGYAEMTAPNPEAAKPESESKVDITELGKETVDGHPCVKKKVVVTDKEGNKHESTVWNATDLKDFPIKIETNEQGHQTTMMFKDVKLSKPDAGQFEPPSDYKKYDNVMSMMMQRGMRGVGRGMGMPPGDQ
jgi:hypothetical protein